MKYKDADSSPLNIVAEVFNIKNIDDKSAFNKSDISLLTEISDKKVILEFNWIEDLNFMVSSFIIEDFDQNILYQQLNQINNSLIIGNLKQKNNKSIVYKHTLPLSSKNEQVFIKKYLEDLLSEFNHLVTILLKKATSNTHSSIDGENKIVGHA
jgi:predicted phosphohydrolase